MSTAVDPIRNVSGIGGNNETIFPCSAHFRFCPDGCGSDPGTGGGPGASGAPVCAEANDCGAGSSASLSNACSLNAQSIRMQRRSSLC